MSIHLLAVRYSIKLNRSRKIKIGKSSSCKNFRFFFIVAYDSYSCMSARCRE